MKKKSEPSPQYARLPNGHKVTIKSQDGETALVMRVGGHRRGTLAVCRVRKLSPV